MVEGGCKNLAAACICPLQILDREDDRAAAEAGVDQGRYDGALLATPEVETVTRRRDNP